MIEYINQIGSTWAEFFGLMILQNTIFLVIIFITLAALKNNSAQLKYIVGMAGIVKLLLPPFLPFYVEGSSSNQTVGFGLVEFGTGTTPALANEILIPTFNTFGILFLAWLVLAVVYLVLALGSTFVLRLKLAAAKPVHKNVQQQSELKLYQTKLISTPLSIGLFPRHVFIPSFFKTLPRQCQQVLINHELAHIKRKDGFFQLLQILAQAVYFFHPLVWLLNERVNEYREMACDDTAIKLANLSPTEYSRYLVHMAENVVFPHWSYSSATALIRQKNKLTNRVNYLLKESKVMKKKMVVAVVVLIGLMIFPLSWYCTQKTETDVVTNPVAETASSKTTIFVAYDEAPSPIGGFAAIQRWVYYPEIARKAGVEGRVYVNVLVDENGDVADTKILKSLGNNGCDESAIYAIKKVKWNPAKQRSKPVSVWVGIPVVFALK